MRITQKDFWLFVSAVLLGVGSALIVNYYRSFQPVTISTDSQIAVSIHKDDAGGPVAATLVSTGSVRTTKLKKGSYVAVSSESGDYRRLIVGFKVEAEAVNLTVSPDWTDQKLRSVLATEQPLIVDTVNKKYPTATGQFTIQNVKLLKRGEWSVAKMVPQNPTGDVYRIILHKENGTWTAATDPPQISIGQPSNPNIPADVISAADGL